MRRGTGNRRRAGGVSGVSDIAACLARPGPRRPGHRGTHPDCPGAPVTSSPALHYRVRPADPAAHLFDVTFTVAHPDADGQVLRLPCWIPGSYMVREFAKNIVTIAARSDAGPVALTKVDKDTWRAAPCDGPLVVSYTVYAWDLSVRMAHLDRTHGFFNGTSMFLAAVGQEHGPHTVDLDPPDDAACAGWQVATTLPRVSGDAWGFGRFEAADHDELVDHPVEMGTFDRVTFEACGVPHHVVFTGRHRCDTARLCRDLTPICEQHIRMFGEPAPVPAYLFLVMVTGDGYGGLEHRASTALICKRDDLPQEGVSEVTDGYRSFLGLCSHEYFHTWNVKRIKPRAFAPYDLSREGYTTLLWAFEGITSYYDDLGLLRAARIDTAAWLELVGQTLTRVLRGSGRLKQSLSDSSFDAWTKFYRQDENAPNAIVSYYAKGAIAALALDLHLRRVTAERVCLDDVMRVLWARYGDGSGVPEGGVEAVASEVAGVDLSPFFDATVRGTDDLPLADLLADVGIDLVLRPANGASDKGGSAATRRKGLPDPGDLGVTVASQGGNARLKHVHDEGAARAAGLSADDVVIALDGLKVGASDLVDRAASYAAGTTLTVHAFRRDELLVTEVTLGARPATTAALVLRDDAPDDVVARRDRWLAGTTVR
ncbi:MAG: M61 family metallopeptidase [Alphaproteobacteria bacterium]|nr:M61 family metallopeptidase [Alphaproteobacteria bacterium]